ncbi:MAG: T9SS type A sorting domain-containing protein [Bacteroidia bacterium]|nr:T9SS type A sorting domain-containing protein [Bacteroidia bacterium]
MRRNFLIIICLFFVAVTNGQYKKMPLDTNHYWHELFFYAVWPSPYSSCDYQYEVIKDTLISSKVYKQVAITNKVCNPIWTCCFYSPNIAFLRQDTLLKIVCVLDTGYKERILYNFNKMVNDTTMLFDPVGGSFNTYTVNTKDSLLLNDGLYHKRLKLTGPGLFGDLIEGVGGSRGLLTNYSQGIGIGTGLTCVGKIYPIQSTIYHSSGNTFSCSVVNGITENSNHALHNITIAPNPSSGLVNISSFNTRAIKTITVKDVLSKEIKTVSDINLSKYSLDISSLENGIYIISITIDSELIHKKIIKH